uniref:uncharacterized protein LOC122589997 n=1 Tax=Erigeron canadensis TaxID=72917 RepID=UPI001CB984C8|nr:uncharacterized protein LOC122589997 [Erigeron canadensis]
MADIFELQQVAFIAADNGKHLVTCSSLFVHLTMNLSPLASKLPSCYLPFLKILEKLGVEDMLLISSAMNILSSLQKAGHDYRLNPNELHAVIELLHFLCNENTKQQISEKCNRELKLVVPDTGCRLVYHDTCVYVDPYGSRYVKFIESSKLRFVHHSVSERLCLAFGIRKLSDVVVEELDQAEHLQTLDVIGSTSLAAVKMKLLNRSFQVAVSSVLKSIPISTSGFKTPDFLALQRSLESVAQRLKFVRCINIRYWLLPEPLDITLASKESLIPEWKTGRSQQAFYYVDRSKTCILIAKPPSYVSVPDLVALVVSQVLGSPVPLPIGSLFLCPRGSDTVLLDILKLSSDERVMDGVGYGSGFLGRDILLRDAKKKQIYPQSPYYQGEIVAWQSQSGEKLKYGRISEDVRPLAGQALYSINVETFPGKTETIMSSHVFPFQTFSVGKDYPTYVRPGDSMHVEHRVESQRVASKNQKHTIKGFEHGGVPAEEFVQAFKEMLSGGRINMDPKRQCLLQTVLSLQEQLKTSQAALVLEQEKSEFSTKEADSAKVALLCLICLTNEIGITMVPCGHLLCHSCSSAVSSCPICGVQLSTTMKIYLP